MLRIGDSYLHIIAYSYLTIYILIKHFQVDTKIISKNDKSSLHIWMCFFNIKSKNIRVYSLINKFKKFFIIR
jgi:hypothetical protein